MDRVVSQTNRPECLLRAESAVDVNFAWTDGSIHLRTQGAQGRCERRMVRQELAIGICFQSPGSAVSWDLDGRTVLDKTWAAQGGSRDLIILPAGHEFVGRCRGSGQGLWIFLNAESVSFDSHIRTFAEKTRVDDSWVRDRLSRTLASELRNECGLGFPRGSLFLEAACTALLIQLAYVFDKVVPQVEHVGVLGAPKLALVLEYINAHLDRNVTLAELAALVDLTPRYLCDVFHRTMGRPPHRYQIEQRIERARALLRDPSIALSEIALMVGFSSQSHLNVYFRRVMGVTPARYRAALHEH
jgi:AraC family transcriptional regulator